MKNFLFFAMCLLITASASAQGYYYFPSHHEHHPPARSQYDDFYKAKVGLTGGVNISNTVDAHNYSTSTGSIVGFNAGITFDLPIIYPLSFAPEVLYSQKGYAAVTPDGNFTQHSDYIDLPLLAKFRLSPTFSFLIGPQISFPISTTNTYDDGFNVTGEQYYNTYGQKRVVAGVVGFAFDLGRVVELRARYAYDLQPNSQNTSANGDFRDVVWQFGLGIKFQ
jgi:hypothetical protein